MKPMPKRVVFIGLLSMLLGLFGAGPAGAKNSSRTGSATSTLRQRIDFGNAYIMGQSIKSGAVYLMHRKQNEIKSMLDYRTDYRDEILEEFNIRNLKIDAVEEKKK